jgi:hypothetical protein
MENYRDPESPLIRKTGYRNLLTKADLTNGKIQFIRWMFLLTIAQALIIELVGHFWKK